MPCAVNRRHWLGLSLLGGALATRPAGARTPITPGRQMPLWPDGAPDPVPAGLKQAYVQRAQPGDVSDRTLHQVTKPFLEMYAPQGRGNGASILIMPGGGYRYMAWDREGIDIARWFARQGVTAFVLGYRLPNDGWSSGLEAPLADAQRGMRLIAQHGADWNLDPRRIAAMGFSAGGHLCANLAARFADTLSPARDATDALPARPALAIPIYPAIRLADFGAALLGQSPAPEAVTANSPHLNVTDDAPPHLLIHAEDDPLVKADHSLALRAALMAKSIAVETHLFARGGHGFGMRLTTGLPVADWPNRVLAFGRSVQWIHA